MFQGYQLAGVGRGPCRRESNGACRYSGECINNDQIGVQIGKNDPEKQSKSSKRD